jgi:hypothetical protein
VDNPDVTVADIITDVEGRFSSVPSISSDTYIPWISYAYQKVYHALSSVNSRCREDLFGDMDTITMDTDSPNEYSLETEIPRFGGFVEVQVKYGATGDEYNSASRLASAAHWKNWANISTTYRSKLTPLYYKRGDTIGFIPVPPESGATAKVFFIKRPYQLTETTDVIEIPYRFLYPLTDYVHARAIQMVNEDYQTADVVEANFRRQIEEIKEAAASEFNENDGTDAIQVSETFSDPFN